MKNIHKPIFQSFIIDVFMSMGVPEDDAKMASEVLIYADLHGIDSHGIARLITYVELLSAKKINPKPNIQVIRRKKSAATVDGDNGLGLVVGSRANIIAAEMAQEFGTGWVSVCNTNHYGAAGYYVAKVVEAYDMIGWSMTSSSKLVAPLWGAEAMFGTNPLGFGIPALNEPPIIIDFATSTVPFGKVELAMRSERALPNGWGINKEGKATNNAQELMDGGALLPLGSERITGGHKGQCLLSMVDILSCVLSGANWGPFGPPSLLWQNQPEKSVGRGIGHFFGVMDIDAFREKDEFKSQMDDWINTIRNTKPQPGTNGPLIPGDPEREAYEIRIKEGLTLNKAVIEDLQRVSKISKVALPLEME